MPDHHLLDAEPGAAPTHEELQQLIEAERGRGSHGILRRWLASDSVRAQPSDAGRVVLTSDASGVKISRDNGTTVPAQVVVDGTPAGGHLTGTYPNPTITTLPASIIDALIPPGTIWAYAIAGLPTGWLFCDGATVSRTTYAKLYAVIGTTYNTGGEAGTDFRLPNLLGRVPLGISGTHAIGTAGGTETSGAHTHVGSHFHTLNQHSHSILGHGHDVDINHNHVANTGLVTGTVDRVAPGTGSNPNHPNDAHGHQLTVNNIGPTAIHSTGPLGMDTTHADTAGATTNGDASAPGATYAVATANLPPFLSVAYIIRAGS